MVTPHASIPTLVSEQASAEVTINEALNRLDACVSIKITDRDLTAPPGSPTEGACYIPAATATGAWAGKEGYVAMYFSGWMFVTPWEGLRAHVADEDLWIEHDGSAWCDYSRPFKSGRLVSVTTGITAATTQTQGQGALTTEINVVTTCANANDTVTLPAAVAGKTIVIVNRGANTLQIFPASGDKIDNGSANASTTIPTLGVFRACAEDDTDWWSSVTQPAQSADDAYGEIYVYDNSGGTAQSIGTSFEKITQFTANGSSFNCTSDHTNDKITVLRTGLYEVYFSISFSGTANAVFTVAASVGGTEQNNVRFTRKLGTGGDVGCAMATGLISLTANDEVTLEVKADGASKDFLVWDANLAIRKA